MPGFEPRLRESKSLVLPLHYIPIYLNKYLIEPREGFKPTSYEALFIAETTGFEPVDRLLYAIGSLANCWLKPLTQVSNIRGSGEIRTPEPFYGVGGFQDRCLKPLGHTSKHSNHYIPLSRTTLAGQLG